MRKWIHHPLMGPFPSLDTPVQGWVGIFFIWTGLGLLTISRFIDNEDVMLPYGILVLISCIWAIIYNLWKDFYKKP